jgi:hypothetical protein
MPSGRTSRDDASMFAPGSRATRTCQRPWLRPLRHPMGPPRPSSTNPWALTSTSPGEASVFAEGAHPSDASTSQLSTMSDTWPSGLMKATKRGNGRSGTWTTVAAPETPTKMPAHIVRAERIHERGSYDCDDFPRARAERVRIHANRMLEKTREDERDQALRDLRPNRTGGYSSPLSIGGR